MKRGRAGGALPALQSWPVALVMLLLAPFSVCSRHRKFLRPDKSEVVAVHHASDVASLVVRQHECRLMILELDTKLGLLDVNQHDLLLAQSPVLQLLPPSDHLSE